MKISAFAFLFSVVFTSVTARAQMGLEGFSTGRYEVRRLPSAEAPAKKTVVKEVVEVPSVKLTSEAATSSPVEGAPAQPAPAATELAETPAQAEKAEPSIGEQAESLFSQKAEKIYEFYRLQVHPDDIRNNKVELDVAPVVVYVDSKSNFSFRQYQSYFNALKIKTSAWLTPRIGLSGQLMMSFAADVDGVQDSSRIPVKYEYLDIALNTRKFFGVSRLSNSLEFSLIFTDSKASFESSNMSRSRLRSHGLGLGMKARIPSSESYAWTVGGTFFPRLQHAETATGQNLSSGSSAENTRAGVELGGEIKFDRASQLIWNLGLNVERNMFDGAAATPDPKTGTTPNNVSVTDSSFLFSLGYRWGH